MSGDEQKGSGLRAVWLFFGLAYAVSWGAAGILHFIALQAWLRASHPVALGEPRLSAGEMGR